MSTGRTYFSFDIDLTFLFKDLKVDKTDVFVGAVVAVFVLAFLSSVLQNILWILSHRSLADAFREKWRFFSSATTRRKSTPTFPLNAYGVSPKINNTASQEHSPTIWSWSAQPKRSRRSRLMSLRNCCSTTNLVNSFVYLASTSLGYILMLLVMTFNVWFLVAACVGLGLGYFVFFASGETKPASTRNCDIKREEDGGSTIGKINSGYWIDDLPQLSVVNTAYWNENNLDVTTPSICRLFHLFFFFFLNNNFYR